MPPFQSAQVEMAFRFYPEAPRKTMLALRELTFGQAAQLGILEEIEETLKWGQPSYLAPTGSTLRMDWEKKDPAHCRLFFHCQTTLVSTFRQIFPALDYEENRAIRIPLSTGLATAPLGQCIQLALTYHTVKHLPLLGARQ